MKDRVPGAPGQYKAVITADEQMKLSAEEPFIITLTRDDHPITEGTPYSKAAVLPDSLAASLCPGAEDPTPADAFAALHAKAVESQEHPGCYYRVVAGETEWINPPMLYGQEYRTTRRHNGKVVYTKLVDMGDLPWGTVSEPGYKWVDLGAEAEYILAWKASLSKETLADDDRTKIIVRYGIPYAKHGTQQVIADIYFRGRSAVLSTTGIMDHGEQANLQIEYTKEDWICK